MNKEASLYFLGGLLTGEGHFGLSVQRKKSGLCVIPNFAVGMTDTETMDTVFNALQEVGLPAYRTTQRRGNNKLMHRIQVSGYKRTKRYCETLIPYLTGDKRHSAEITLAFVESRMKRPRGRGVESPYSEYEIGLVNQLRDHHGRGMLSRNHL